MGVGGDKGFTQTDGGSGREMERRGIELTQGKERGREGGKGKKNRVGKQQIEMDGGEQWIPLTDGEKSCGFGA